MKINKEKLKVKLKKHLNREPSNNELINAEKDINITVELLYEELQEVKGRLLLLEKKSKIK